MNYKYIITEIKTDLLSRVVEVSSQCVTCSIPISNYTGYYSVTQQLEDWTDCPTNHVCSEKCANMLILAALDEGLPWPRKIRAKWSVETPAQIKAIYGMDL